MTATGCVSFGSRVSDALTLDRVIETFSVNPVSKTCGIWLDVFVDNVTVVDQTLLFLHRGSLSAEIVTRDAWSSTSVRTRHCPITARLVKLHEQFDKIETGADNVISLGGERYKLLERQDGKLEPALPQAADEQNVPFTMWEIGPFPANEKRLLRVRMSLGKKTYAAQIADGNEFYAYGDSILLDRITEDLMVYSGPDQEGYRKLFDAVTTRIVPQVFEYVLLSEPGSPQWETTPLSYNFSPQLVPAEYETTTHWFVARYPKVDTFAIAARRVNARRPRNAFALRVKKADQKLVPHLAR